MCNLYTQSEAVDELARIFREMQVPLQFPEGIPNLQPREIAITDSAPIVRSNATGYELVVRRWSWPAPGGKPVFNYRSDGREFSKGRCLILADGFFEFTAPSEAKAKRKHKWLFTLPGASLFAVAGLWRSDPAVGEAFTMLTTEPGDDVRPYHNRQIAVLPPSDFTRWLDSATPVEDVLKPLPAGSLKVEQIC
jgi:putative SOS response-associated peptidase YedK